MLCKDPKHLTRFSGSLALSMVIVCKQCHRKSEFADSPARGGAGYVCGWSDCRQEVHIIFPPVRQPRRPSRWRLNTKSQTFSGTQRIVTGTPVKECLNPACRANNRIPDSPRKEYRCARCGWKLNELEHREYIERKAQEAEQARREAEKRAELRRSEGWWKRLDGTMFEKELAGLFQARGYEVQRTGRAGDKGVDLRFHAVGRTIVVQCKAHKSRVSPAAVRDLYGTLQHHGADEAWLVTATGFTPGAKRFAVGKRLRLLTIRQILEAKELIDY
jgi:hypothetical protein